MLIIYKNVTAAEVAAAEAALGAVTHDYVVRGPYLAAGHTGRVEPAGQNRGDGTVKP
jgi:hypothetical protein